MRIFMQSRLLLWMALACSAHAAESTTTVLVDSANGVVYGQPLTLTATVSPSAAPGAVAFFDGVTLLETEPVSSGVATLTVSQLTPGLHPLTALFVPSTVAYAGSTSPALQQTITQAPAGTFLPAVDYPISAGTGIVAIGDLNGDGKPDVAVFGSSLAITLLGDGAGGLGAAVTTAIPAIILGAAIADFNGDGKADIVIAGGESGSGGAAVLLGNGDGTFQQPPLNIAFNGSPISVAVGDFNRDGIPDLAVGSGISVSILLGIGDGTFEPQVNYSVTGALSIVVGDFNGDGIADLALEGGGISILLGRGDGTFAASTGYPVVGTQGSLAVGDFNGDGKADLAVPNTTGVAILLGKGDGSFEPAVEDSVYGYGVEAVAVADFNDDGKADLALIQGLGGGGYSNGVLVQYGNGDGTFQTPLSYGTGEGASFAAVGEFNGDGSPDLAVTNYSSGGLSMLLSRGSSCLQVTPGSTLALDATGGTGMLTISTTSASCVWTATASAPWMQLSSSGGTGSGQVIVTIGANTTGADLTGTILFQAATFGSQPINVTQRFEVQTFSDVPPSADYFDAVELMAAKAITTGCTAATFCPTDDVTRAQMAIFLVRMIIGGDTFTYTETPYFTVVPVGAFGFQWIQKLRDLGITSGCTPTLFCPDDDVTRAQMAIFIIRARYGASFPFDYPSTPFFDDVPPGAFGFGWIQRMKEDNITGGCSAVDYCPSDSIIRGDMATFVMRGGFNELLPAGEAVISAVSPATIAAGASGTYTLTGVNTNFTASTAIEDMPGITVSAVNVLTPTSLTMQLSAASGAVLQPVSILAVTGNEEAVLPNGLVIQ